MKRIPAYALLFLVALLFSDKPVLSQTSWIDSTGDWFTATNWSAGVPNTSNSGEINNGGTALIKVAGAEGFVTLGSGPQDSGSLSVSGAGHMDGDVAVGVSGTANLSITGGGVVSSGRFVMADQAGSDATATVSGPGSMWNNLVVCFVGFLGNAKLNISDGGQVSMSTVSIAESDGSSGVVNVDGAGSVLMHFTGVTVGGNGSGRLNITNGGSVVGIDPTFGGGVVGRNPGSKGTVNVSGNGSKWMNAGPLAIADGFAGTSGALHITNSGMVSNSFGIVGGAEGIGSVTVDGGGSTWTNNGNLFIGTDAGSGTLSITHGGKVSSDNGDIAFGGFEAGSSVGTVVVDGIGSSWTNSGNLFVGSGETGATGKGTLRVQNGGTVSAAATTVLSEGTLEIGPNATLNSALIFDGGKLRPIANVTFANDASITGTGVIVDSNSFNSTLAGRFSGTAGLTKLGSGAIVLANANTYTGPTTLESGTLLVNGSITSDVVVNGGTLGGAGTTGTISVNNGGVLSPGNSPGILHVNGDLSFLQGSTYLVELNGLIAGTQYDQTDVNGMVNLDNATLSALLSFSPTSTSFFTIINNDLSDPISGIFSGLPEGAMFRAGNEFLTISYRGGDGNDAVLTAQGTAVADNGTTLVLLSVSLAALFGFGGGRLLPFRVHKLGSWLKI